jgi:hypothetical protein
MNTPVRNKPAKPIRLGLVRGNGRVVGFEGYKSKYLDLRLKNLKINNVTAPSPVPNNEVWIPKIAAQKAEDDPKEEFKIKKKTTTFNERQPAY